MTFAHLTPSVYTLRLQLSPVNVKCPTTIWYSGHKQQRTSVNNLVLWSNQIQHIYMLLLYLRGSLTARKHCVLSSSNGFYERRRVSPSGVYLNYRNCEWHLYAYWHCNVASLFAPRNRQRWMALALCLALGYVRVFNYTRTLENTNLQLRSITPHLSHNISSQPRVFFALEDESHFQWIPLIFLWIFKYWLTIKRGPNKAPYTSCSLSELNCTRKLFRECGLKN